MSQLELTVEQGAAVGKVDAALAKIVEGFEEFALAAVEADRAGVPGPILHGKAMELQQSVMRQMTGG